MTPEQELQALTKLFKDLGIEIPEQEQSTPTSQSGTPGIHPITANVAAAWKTGQSTVQAYHDTLEDNDWTKSSVKQAHHFTPLWKEKV